MDRSRRGIVVVAVGTLDHRGAIVEMKRTAIHIAGRSDSETVPGFNASVIERPHRRRLGVSRARFIGGSHAARGRRPPAFADLFGDGRSENAFQSRSNRVLEKWEPSVMAAGDQ